MQSRPDFLMKKPGLEPQTFTLKPMAGAMPGGIDGPGGRLVVQVKTGKLKLETV